MDSGPTLKHKVTVQFNHLKTTTPARPPSRSNAENIPSRPASPTKSYVTTATAADSTTFRPKAKVNSSATTRKTTAGKSPTTATPSASRPGSPTKLAPRIRNGVTSPTGYTPRVPSTSRTPTVRSPPVASASVTPELRNRSLTATSGASSPISPPEDTRVRTGSVSSLQHAVSFSTFPRPPSVALSVSDRTGTHSASSSPRLAPSRSVVGAPDRAMTSSPSLRIRSKVTAGAKPGDLSSPPTPNTPAFPSGRANAARIRTASISSSLSQQLAAQTSSSPPPQQFYPITTAAPAANPHRFQSARPPARTTSPPINQIFQSFSQQPLSKLRIDESPSPRNRVPSAKLTKIQAKVDPASIPLPPLSPPASSVSFSSRSSVSRSSTSMVDGNRPGSRSSSAESSQLGPVSTQQQNGNMDHLKSTLDSLVSYTSGLPSAEDDVGSESEPKNTNEHKVKATAKSNRKIADLEITNRSLLAINATLEATKHRQAKEIRELKRKLRESRLILPPLAYRAIKSSLGPEEIEDDEEDVDDTEDLDEEDDKDEAYQRIKLMVDNLVKSGQRALEKQTKDFPEGSKGGAKVLSAEEVRDWHQSSTSDDTLAGRDTLRGGDKLDVLHDDMDNDSSYASVHQYDTDDLDASFDRSNQSFTVEDEGELMTMVPGSTPSSPPPIFITKPS